MLGRLEKLKNESSFLVVGHLLNDMVLNYKSKFNGYKENMDDPNLRNK